MNYNDVYYVAALIEYVSRKTKNRRRYVVKKIGMEGIRHLLEDANANHCLSIGQVSEEVVEDYGIEMGEFDSVGKCQYKVPGYLPIGKNYARLVEDVESNPERYPEALYVPRYLMQCRTSIRLSSTLAEKKLHTHTKTRKRVPDGALFLLFRNDFLDSADLSIRQHHLDASWMVRFVGQQPSNSPAG